VWQDSLISITYDRASSTPTISHHKSVHDSKPTCLSYIDCMKTLCETGLDIVRERTGHIDPRRELARIKKHQEDLINMMEQALPHLKDATGCKSMRDQLEHWNLYLHRSYISSEQLARSLPAEYGEHRGRIPGPAERDPVCDSVLGCRTPGFELGVGAWYSETASGGFPCPDVA